MFLSSNNWKIVASLTSKSVIFRKSEKKNYLESKSGEPLYTKLKVLVNSQRILETKTISAAQKVWCICDEYLG